MTDGTVLLRGDGAVGRELDDAVDGGACLACGGGAGCSMCQANMPSRPPANPNTANAIGDALERVRATATGGPLLRSRRPIDSRGESRACEQTAGEGAVS